MDFDWLQLFFSFIFGCFGFWFGTGAWIAIIRAFEPDISIRQAIRYHLWSVALKYLPGLGWQQVSKVVQLRMDGTLTMQAVLPVALELGLVALTGLALAALILTFETMNLFGVSLSHGLVSSAALFLWAICIGLPVIIGKAKGDNGLKRPSPKWVASHLWLAQLLDVLGWIANGVAFWFCIRALVPISAFLLSYSIVTIIFAMLFGLVILFAPNGIGVRELTMVLLLQPILSPSLAVIVALAHRLIMILVDLFGAFLMVLCKIAKSRMPTVE